MPNRVWLYRRPILDYWAEHDETLGAIVTHVLVHEIATISASPTTTWKRSRTPPIDHRAQAAHHLFQQASGQTEEPPMDKFTTLTGVAAPLHLINIDTVMIIPKDY